MSTMSPNAGDCNAKQYYDISNPARSIAPNGTAPIGSEVAYLKEFNKQKAVADAKKGNTDASDNGSGG